MQNFGYLKYFFTYMRDPEFPLYEKIIMLLGILYIIIPMDLIPEFVFPVGFLDDSVVLAGLIFFMTRAFKDYYKKTLVLRKKQIEEKERTNQNEPFDIEDDW